MKDALSILSSGKVLLATVSGASSTKPQMIEYFDQEVPAIDIITTKSFQVRVNPGNREPVICETETGCFGNSVGLRNCGMEEAEKELSSLHLRALLNVSLSASSPEDFITLVRTLSPYGDMVELNFSCPHAAKGYGASIGCDAAIASRYVAEIRKALPFLRVPLFVKLTPNVEDIGTIAKACVDAGADGVTAINTVGPVVHIDPASGKPVLLNKLGGKGGMSGRWVREKALEAVASIRRAIGKEIPIIGMGGVFTGEDAKAMIAAGTNAVGIGSALAMVNQRVWPEYLESVKKEAEGEKPKDSSFSFLRTGRAMAYVRHTVEKIERHGSDISVIQLDGNLPSEAGQFVFLWLPGVGEKPFSVATTEPLSFVIKGRGTVSDALCSLKEGEEVYLRGLYGAPVEVKETKHALLIAGGTGVAVLPMLCAKLKRQGTEMRILVGTSGEKEEKPLLHEELTPYGEYTTVADDGKPGRALSLLDDMEFPPGMAVYLVGPEKFMSVACAKLISRGVPSSMISLSMERLTRCGVGLCGECVCGHRLACQWGTFMEYDYLKKEAPELLLL
jgi:dihydroorotate dehydrogenase (NAD+) catalytic subunit